MVSKDLSVCLRQTLTPIISGLTEQNGLKQLFDLSSKQNQKPFEKKFANLKAKAVFVSLFFSKTANL